MPSNRVRTDIRSQLQKLTALDDETEVENELGLEGLEGVGGDVEPEEGDPELYGWCKNPSAIEEKPCAPTALATSLTNSDN